MVDHYISLPLYSDAYYTYSVAFEGNSYNLEFVYNERAQLYFVSLLDADSNYLVAGEALVPNYPIFKDYVLSPITGFLYMEEKADIVKEAYKVYPENIDQYYNLFYLYTTED